MTQRRRIIILNGPPQSGKDTIADLLVQHMRSYGQSIVKLKLAQPLREHLERVESLARDPLWFEANKDTHTCSTGRTLRNEMIHYFETEAEKRGDAWMSDILADRIEKVYQGVNVVITDAGRMPELESFADVEGILMLVRVRRAGYKFTDNRTWLYPTFDYKESPKVNGRFLESELVNEEGRPLKAVTELIHLIENSTF